MLKIQRSANGQVIFKLSGRIDADEVGELQELFALEAAGRELVLDLKDVTLVNQDAVTFLGEMRDKPHQTRKLPRLYSGMD